MAITSILFTFDDVDNEFQYLQACDNGASSEWYVGLVGPNGTIKTQDFDTPDGTGVISSVVIVNPDGSFVEGNYTMTVTLYPNGSSGSQETSTLSFAFDATGELTYTITSDSTTITFTDATVYPSISGNFTRTSTVVAPVVSGLSTLPNVDFSSQSYTQSMALSDGRIYENVTWTVTGTASATVLEASGLWQVLYNKSFTGSSSLTITVSQDVCSVISCVDAEWLDLYAEACNRGGLSKLSTTKRDQFDLLLGTIQMYSYWLQCGNDTKTDYYYNQLIELTGSECIPSNTPTAVSSTTTAGADSWVTIPSGSYETNFDPASGTPLQFRIYGKMLYFKGFFTPAVVTAAGANMILATYWTSVGITLEPNVSVLGADQDGSAPGEPIRITIDGSGNMVVGGGSVATHDFAISAPIPIQ